MIKTEEYYNSEVMEKRNELPVALVKENREAIHRDIINFAFQTVE